MSAHTYRLECGCKVDAKTERIVQWCADCDEFQTKTRARWHEDHASQSTGAEGIPGPAILLDEVQP